MLALLLAAAALGKPAPDFALADARGGPAISLAELKGRVAVIVFLGTRCPVSNSYAHRLRTLAEDFADKNVAFVGINPNPGETEAEVREHAQKRALPFPVLRDEQRAVAQKFGATKVPEAFVIDAGGVVRYHGRIDNSQDEGRVGRQDLRLALEAIVAGRAPAIPETRPMGCGIQPKGPR